MKIIYFTLLLLLSIGLQPNSVLSQTYSNIPGDTIEVSAFMEDLEILTIQQLNTSNNPITLKWQKVSASVPPIWEAAVCDNVLCHPALADSGTMNPVNPGSFGYLLMHITGHVNFGSAVIRYAVWDAALPAIKDTLTYIMHVYDPTSIESIHNLAQINIYPNPVRDFLNISIENPDSHSIKIIASSGDLIFNSKTSSNIKINIGHWASGTYYVLIGSDTKYSVKKIIKE